MTTDYLIKPKNTPHQAIVFLHGYGTDGGNLIDLYPYFNNESKNILFCAPNAPTVCEQNSSGWQWFSLIDWSPPSLMKGIHQAAPYLKEYLLKLQQDYHLRQDQISVIGFSQGAMMALYCALHDMPNLNAIIAFSGALITVPPVKISHTPLLLIHGTQDTVVPVQASIDAYQILKSHHYSIELFTVDNLGHSINHPGLLKAQEFLQNLHIRDTLNPTE